MMVMIMIIIIDILMKNHSSGREVRKEWEPRTGRHATAAAGSTPPNLTEVFYTQL